MEKTKKSKKNYKQNHKRLSLYPLDFKKALSTLLQVKTKAKAKKKTQMRDSNEK